MTRIGSGKWRIELAEIGALTRIYHNDEEVRDLTFVSVEAGVDGVTCLTLKVTAPDSIEIEGTPANLGFAQPAAAT